MATINNLSESRYICEVCGREVMDDLTIDEHHCHGGACALEMMRRIDGTGVPAPVAHCSLCGDPVLENGVISDEYAFCSQSCKEEALSEEAAPETCCRCGKPVDGGHMLDGLWLFCSGECAWEARKEAEEADFAAEMEALRAEARAENVEMPEMDEWLGNPFMRPDWLY